MNKTACILGINAQSARPLVDILIAKGYQIKGLVRDIRVVKPWIKGRDSVAVFDGDITDFQAVQHLVGRRGYEVIFNLAARSHVGESFSDVSDVMMTNGLAVQNLLEAIKDRSPHTRLVQASTVEIYGTANSVITEDTAASPVSPYGVAKLFAHDCVRLYREAYGLFAANAILSNMESTDRSDRFITRKISSWAANIYRGFHATLRVGNLDAKRDWGHVEDFADGMVRIAEQENPEDYVLATERSTTVRNLITQAAGYINRELRWSGNETGEVAHDQWGNLMVSVDPRLYRVADVAERRVSTYKARTQLGWLPKHSSAMIIAEMVRHDINHRGAVRPEVPPV